MKKKLLIKLQNKWLNVSRGQNRSEQQESGGCWSRADVCHLADLATGFILCIIVEVTCGLRTKNNEEEG